jgi:uncharacterized protein
MKLWSAVIVGYFMLAAVRPAAAQDVPRIDYSSLLEGVVKHVLKRTSREGLPGKHHFQIKFCTRMKGVRISTHLRDLQGPEMTIVLQHRFWDLVVLEDRFEVTVTFDSIPERLVVPFAAIATFSDPSESFDLDVRDCPPLS